MNRTKNLTVMFLAAILFGAASCKEATNSNTASNQAANKAVTSANSNTAATPAVVDTTTDVAGTPTAAYKAAYAARKNKDVPALKKLMSKDILEFFTEIAGLGEKKQTVDELLMELCEKEQAPTAEARNEKIDGDKATIEYLDETGKWSPMEFVKEDGSWKLTIEKPKPGELINESDPKGKDKK